MWPPAGTRGTSTIAFNFDEFPYLLRLLERSSPLLREEGGDGLSFRLDMVPPVETNRVCSPNSSSLSHSNLFAPGCGSKIDRLALGVTVEFRFFSLPGVKGGVPLLVGLETEVA